MTGNCGQQGLRSLLVSTEEAAMKMAAAAVKRRADFEVAALEKGASVNDTCPSANSPHLGNNVDIHA
jgi:hypothetical protein